MAPLPKYLTQDELKRFFAAIDSPRDKALFGLIYHYGLRVGEALMLTVDDVNFTNHRDRYPAVEEWARRRKAAVAAYGQAHTQLSA